MLEEEGGKETGIEETRRQTNHRFAGQVTHTLSVDLVEEIAETRHH